MPWKNLQGDYSKTRPIRIRLIDGSTRTGPEITDTLLAELGWSEFYEPENNFVPHIRDILPGHENE